jgi:hypothetical protein
MSRGLPERGTPRNHWSAIAVIQALVAVLALADSTHAAPKVGQRTSDCKNWDCSGGIICSCCFSNGCWICDAKSDGTPNTDYPTSKYCRWEDAVRNQGVAPGTTAPGGGVLDPNGARSVTPKLQLPTTEGAVQ